MMKMTENKLEAAGARVELRRSEETLLVDQLIEESRPVSTYFVQDAGMIFLGVDVVEFDGVGFVRRFFPVGGLAVADPAPVAVLAERPDRDFADHLVVVA